MGGKRSTIDKPSAHVTQTQDGRMTIFLVGPGTSIRTIWAILNTFEYRSAPGMRRLFVLAPAASH